MGKQSKRKKNKSKKWQQASSQQKKGPTQPRKQPSADGGKKILPPGSSLLLPANSKTRAYSSSKAKLVQTYKTHTQCFKDSLIEHSSLEFFRNDCTKSISNAVNYIIQASKRDACGDLIPPLREAIQGRLRVAAMYCDKKDEGHDYFNKLLQTQHDRLEALASPLYSVMPPAAGCGLDDSRENSAGPESTRATTSLMVNGNDPSIQGRPTLHSPKTLWPLFEKLFCQEKISQKLHDLLLLAVMLDDAELVVSLLRASQKSCTSSDSLHAMRSACFLGRVAVVDALIEFGCPVQGPEYRGELPIFVAVVMGQVSMLAHLVQKHRANVNALCGIDISSDSGTLPYHDMPPLHHAASLGNVRVTKFLLENGANAMKRCGRTDATALHYAAAGPSPEVVRILLQAGIPVNDRTGAATGETALHTAAMWGRFDNVLCLLKHGADVYSRMNNTSKDMPIHSACEDGHIDVIQALIDFGCNIDARDAFQNTPLMLAIHYNHRKLASTLVDMGADVNASNTVGPILHKTLRNKQYDLVPILLDHGADVNAQEESDGETPLHALCRDKDAPLVLLLQLVKKGATVDAKLQNGATPLHFAFGHRSVSAAEALIDHGADLFVEDNSGASPFAVAIQMGSVEGGGAGKLIFKYLESIVKDQDIGRILRMRATMLSLESRIMIEAIMLKKVLVVTALVDAGFYVDMAVEDKTGNTALHLAVEICSLEVAKVLLEKGASSNARDKNGWTPLHFSSQLGHTDMALLLIEHGACVDTFNSDGESALVTGVKNERVALVKCLVQHGADVDLIPPKYPTFTALQGASVQGSVEIAQTLLEYGAKTETRSYEGYTALLYAVERGHAEVARCLLQHGADMHAKLPDERSVLYTACIHGFTDIVHLLLGHGADANRRTYKGYTVLHCMCLADQATPGIVRCLLAHGAKVSEMSPYGDNALHIAAARGCLEMVELLVDEGGADVNIRNLGGQTALELAYGLRMGMHQHVVAFLLERGAPFRVEDDRNMIVDRHAESYNYLFFIVGALAVGFSLFFFSGNL